MTAEIKECQFCFSEIPKKATKCKYCMEWQEQELKETELTSINVIDFSDRFPNLDKPFQHKIVQKIPFHYVISIFIIAALFFAAIQFSWYRIDEDRIYLWSFLAFTIQMVFSWAGLIWIDNIIRDNYLSFIQISSKSQQDAENLFVTYYKTMFNKAYSIIVGIIIALIAVVGDHMVGTPFESTQAKITFAILEFFNMFFAGAGIYSLFIYSIFIYKISKTDSSEQALSLDSSDSINNLGQIHLKTCVIAIVPLFLGVIAKFIGQWSWEIRIVLWYSTFAAAIIAYIYWPMRNIHIMMKKDIERQTNLIQNKIQKTLVEINTSKSVRSVVRLNELRELEKSISNEPTWPFDPKGISAAFSAIVVPIILMVIDKLCDLL